VGGAKLFHLIEHRDPARRRAAFTVDVRHDFILHNIA
jgi:hypothetical protein